MFSKAMCATWLSILLARDSQIANAITSDLVCSDLDIEKARDCFRKISAPNHLPLWKKARTVSARQMIWGFPTFMVRRSGGHPFLMESHSRRHQLLHPGWSRRATGPRAGDHLSRELNVLQLFSADRLTSSWWQDRMIHRTSNNWPDWFSRSRSVDTINVCSVLMTGCQGDPRLVVV